MIIYYNNTIDFDGRNNPRNFVHLDCELYTFDHKDAKTYKITQKDYYYNCYDKVSLYNNVSEINDIFFVGVDKGRLHKLIKVKKMLYNYKCVYHIVPQKHKRYNEMEKIYLSDCHMPYEDVMKNVACCKCVLEIKEAGQSGLTLRAIEALYFRKKLITSDENIVFYPWYNSNNIFILKEGTTLEEIEKFFKKDYKELPNEMYTMYNPEYWLESFFIN